MSINKNQYHENAHFRNTPLTLQLKSCALIQGLPLEQSIILFSLQISKQKVCIIDTSWPLLIGFCVLQVAAQAQQPGRGRAHPHSQFTGVAHFEPIPHDHDFCERVVINVSILTYEVIHEHDSRHHFVCFNRSRNFIHKYNPKHLKNLQTI